MEFEHSFLRNCVPVQADKGVGCGVDAREELVERAPVLVGVVLGVVVSLSQHPDDAGDEGAAHGAEGGGGVVRAEMVSGIC